MWLFNVFHGLSGVKSQSVTSALFFVFARLCVFTFCPQKSHHTHTHTTKTTSRLLRLSLKHEKHTRHLCRNTRFTHHAQSAQRLVVLILIQEAALTFETWAKKYEGLSKGNYIKCWIRLNYLLFGYGKKCLFNFSL